MDEPTPSKVCPACNRDLPFARFYRDKRTKDGLHNACKDCHNRRTKRWNAANRPSRNLSEPISATCRHCGAPFTYTRQHKKDNKPRDLCSEACRQAKRNGAKARWRAANREQHVAANKAWNKANPERMAAAGKRWRESNREAYLAAQRFYNQQRQTPPEAKAEYQRRRRAAQKSRLVGRITPALLAAKCAYWLNRCWRCGSPEIELDHVKPLAKDGLHCLANIRPICRSCNATKSDRWPFPVTAGPVLLAQGMLRIGQA